MSQCQHRSAISQLRVNSRFQGIFLNSTHFTLPLQQWCHQRIYHQPSRWWGVCLYLLGGEQSRKHFSHRERQSSRNSQGFRLSVRDWRGVDPSNASSPKASMLFSDRHRCWIRGIFGSCRIDVKWFLCRFRLKHLCGRGHTVSFICIQESTFFRLIFYFHHSGFISHITLTVHHSRLSEDNYSFF